MADNDEPVDNSSTSAEPEIPVIEVQPLPKMPEPPAEIKPADGALEYGEVTSLQYADAMNTWVNAQVEFLLSDLGVLPYTLGPNDVTPHGMQIYADVLAGKYGPIAPYEPPPIEELSAAARLWRDSELSNSQWLVERHRDEVDTGAATTLTTAQYRALQVYRQKLRDWPEAAGFPADSSRPETPDWLPEAEAAAK